MTWEGISLTIVVSVSPWRPAPGVIDVPAVVRGGDARRVPNNAILRRSSPLAIYKDPPLSKPLVMALDPVVARARRSRAGGRLGGSCGGSVTYIACVRRGTWRWHPSKRSVATGMSATTTKGQFGFMTSSRLSSRTMLTTTLDTVKRSHRRREFHMLPVEDD